MNDQLTVNRLGWAGIELVVGGRRLVIDLFEDHQAFAPYMEVTGPLPPPGGPVDVALLTHLHADHADPAALGRALTSEGRILRPPAAPGDELDRASTAMAEAGLAGSSARVELVQPWETREVGPFTISAVPAVDGFGDPQVSWVVEAAGRRILHCGDTMFHGWWPIASRFKPFDAVFLPINGPVTSFPHRQPASPFPVAMGPAEAAAAAAILGALVAVPIHYDGIAVPGLYEPAEDPLPTFEAAAAELEVMTAAVGVGESLNWAAAT